MTFEEWWEHFNSCCPLDITDEEIAKYAWDAAMEQAQTEDLEVAYMAGLKDASSRRLPEGYVLVPVEPTEKMLTTAWKTYFRNDNFTYDCYETYEFIAVYKAMIQAAQEEE